MDGQATKEGITMRWLVFMLMICLIPGEAHAFPGLSAIKKHNEEVRMNTRPVIKVERIHPCNVGEVVATVDLIILDTFMVKGIQIIETVDGLEVAMPLNSKGSAVFYPVSKEMRKGLDELILESYKDIK